MLPSDVTALIILAIVVVLFIWKWIPSSAVGCLGLAAMVLCGVCSFEEAFSGFSSSIVILMASAMIVGIAMFKTGAAQVIGRAVISLSHGSEKTFLLAGCIIAGLLSMFFANTAILAAFISIISSVCQSSKRMHQQNLVLPMACSVMFGGACTLIGCTPQLTANALLTKMTGEEMGMWTLTAPGLLIFAVFIAYIYFFGYRRSQKIWSGREGTDMAVRKADDFDPEQSYDPRKVRLMLIVAALMIVSYIAEVIPAALTAVLAALLCVVLRLCTVRDIERELNWETVVFLAACLGLAEALTVSGAGDLIGEAVSAALTNVNSPFLIFAALVLLSIIISQFITNSTAAIIVLPIAFSLCETYGYQVMPFCVGITFGVSFACCTPLAAAQIAMTQVAGYEFADYVKYGWPLTIVAYLGILIFVPLFYPLV